MNMIHLEYTTNRYGPCYDTIMIHYSHKIYLIIIGQPYKIMRKSNIQKQQARKGNFPRKWWEFPTIYSSRGSRTSHRRHRSIYVAHKSITNSSTYVKFVIKYVDAMNPLSILILCGPHNRNWQG